VYPIVLNMRGRLAVVVGGGPVAQRKIAGLLEAGATVRMIAPTATEELGQLGDERKIAWEQKRFEPSDLQGAILVFAATDDPATNAVVVTAARERQILVDDAADAELGDFATPAIHRSGPLTVAVDTGGASPSFALRVRDAVAGTIDDRYGRSARALGAARRYAQATLPPDERATVMRQLAERDLDSLATLSPTDAENVVDTMVADLRTPSGQVPEVRGNLVCASRSSALAMTQARSVMAALARGGIASTVVAITTKGDQMPETPLAEIGTESIFVKELELALRERRVDYAVHSCKDLPSALPGDMQLAAVTERIDPRDVFCSEKFSSFEKLPEGAKVGTSSPRRRAQLESIRVDLEYLPIRGNIDTRLDKLRNGEYDAIVLAAAGIDRLDVGARHTVPFPVDVMLPAVGQGALGIETRFDDRIVGALRAALNDSRTELAVTAERAFLHGLRGGCQAPIAAYATLEGEQMTLRVAVGLDRLREMLRGTRRETVTTRVEAEALGTALAAEIGAARLELAPLDGQVFLLARTQGGASRIAPVLREAGAEVIEAYDTRGARKALGNRVPNVILLTSSRSVNVIGEYLDELRSGRRRPIVAVMGPTSSAAADAIGWRPDVVAPSPDVGAFVGAITRFMLQRNEVRR
jgi:hydroxymethylbilane synthase